MMDDCMESGNHGAPGTARLPSHPRATMLKHGETLRRVTGCRPAPSATRARTRRAPGATGEAACAPTCPQHQRLSQGSCAHTHTHMRACTYTHSHMRACRPCQARAHAHGTARAVQRPLWEKKRVKGRAVQRAPARAPGGSRARRAR